MAIQISGSTIIDNNRNITSANAITATGDITAFFSDERLKDFEGKIENSTEKLESINGYYYRANKTAQSLGYTDELQVGVSAQELQSVLPEVIARSPISDHKDAEEEYLTVKYDKIVPLLIEAIKEQNVRIKELESKIGS